MHFQVAAEAVYVSGTMPGTNPAAGSKRQQKGAMPKNPTTTLKVWTRNDDARNCHLYVDADAAVLKVIMDGAKDRQTLEDRMI
eukprot:COSAG02_NODE_9619_length_2159_cov_1.753883_1_plen_82_part_10